MKLNLQKRINRRNNYENIIDVKFELILYFLMYVLLNRII
jgi:hypothetical protein